MFIEIPATEKAILKRKTLYGVGINDADYAVNTTIDGNKYSCQFFARWRSMLEREIKQANGNHLVDYL